MHFVKICGITSVHDAVVVREAGASAIGVNFTTSTRRVGAPLAHEIVASSPGLIHVGIFRDDESSYVLAMTDASGIDVVQIHGTLDGTLLEELRGRNVGVIKALSVGTEEFFSFDETNVDAVHLDGLEPGSGREHSWEALTNRSFAVPVIAAGGLNADSVASVIELVKPWGVDVATGVESSPGVKDPDRVTRFVQMAMSALEREGAA
jgi:phosphoribosylanthranilate isomerase